jgi:hypothetical protein
VDLRANPVDLRADTIFQPFRANPRANTIFQPFRADPRADPVQGRTRSGT